jgi:hypothetical protein
MKPAAKKQKFRLGNQKGIYNNRLSTFKLHKRKKVK